MTNPTKSSFISTMSAAYDAVTSNTGTLTDMEMDAMLNEAITIFNTTYNVDGDRKVKVKSLSRQ